MGRLNGKIAIITGASAGIGRAAAKLFSKEGAVVILAARREHLLQDLVDEIKANNGIATALAGDVNDEGYSRALVDVAQNDYGGLDIAYNNAGIMGAGGSVEEISLQDLKETLGTNLIGATLGAKHQVAAMSKRGGGSIIFTSSYIGYSASLPRTAVYGMSKAGLFSLAQTIAVEAGPRGIRANTLMSGGVHTSMGSAVAKTPEALNLFESFHSLKRLATPEEVASVALFLASDESSFVTGTAVPVDGGASINKI